MTQLLIACAGSEIFTKAVAASMSSTQEIDCGQPNCGISSAHAHKAFCRCPKVPTESRRIINLFRPMCDRHKAAQWEAAVGRRSGR
ncbi:hypothetical protein C8R47DRAFT_1213446 [Mycena vitilis]|nr:hypothetical protein C8R47DRAFT_1213446 [Mycena vitilis]